MDLWEAVVVAFRRWYVLIPVLIIGVFLALRVAESVSPVHEASATVQYIPAPTNTPEDAELARANPYQDLRSLAIAVELTATAESFVRGLANSGFDAEFTMVTDPRLPVLYITTASTSSETALETLAVLLDFTKEESNKRQADQFGEFDDLFVRTDVLREDESTTIDVTSRTRARVLLLVVAVVGAVASAVLVDTVVRALRRRGEPDDAPEEPAVVWFGVPVQAGQSPPVAPQPQQPYLAPAPEEPPRMTGTSGGGDGDIDPSSRSSRWSR